MKNSAAYLFASLLAAIYCLSAEAATIYVDNQLSGNCTGNYSITNRNCSGSDGNAYNTLAGAANVAVAGDTVLIRAGTFNQQLSPANSGTASAYIVFKNYNNEQVTISGASLVPAIWIDQKSYIIIDGLAIKNVQRWLACLGGDYNIIQNNTFKNAYDAGGSSKTGLFFQSSDYNKILNNIIDSTTEDNIGMVNCDYNLIEGNTITRANHVLWAIKCGHHNVLRNNYFHNQFQKIGEIYDCDDVGYGSAAFPKITSVDDTKYNVVEENIFAYTFTPIDASPYAGIQYAAQNGIIRRNVFYNCIGPPIDITLYSGEAEYNYSNRIYHNVMYNNHFGGIAVPASAGSYTSYDNIFRNNIAYKNNFVQYDFRWDWYDTLGNKPMQIMIGNSSSILSTYTSVFDNNNIFSSTPNELYVIAYGDRNSSTNPSPYSLSWWETNHSNYFRNNLQTNPMFVDTATKDFHLQSGSPMIDAGRFLAETAGAGTNSTTMVVDTAGYFMYGFGIAGLSGDTIQLQGQTQTAVITAINYITNTLTLNTPLTWSTGQKVSLKYYGASPDVGAYEYVIPTFVIEEQSAGFNANIYPNPATGRFQVSSFKFKVQSMEVYNIMGEKVFQSSIVNHQLSIDISSQPSGVYFVKIKTEDKEFVRKIIITN